MTQHPILRLLEQGLCVTVNADDPAFFGGYLVDNYMALVNALNLSEEQAIALAANSIEAAFIDEEAKNQWLATLGQL